MVNQVAPTILDIQVVELLLAYKFINCGFFILLNSIRNDVDYLNFKIILIFLLFL